MFQKKFESARPLLEAIINSGKYVLVNYADNFNPAKRNDSESIFSVQVSVNDREAGMNGNFGDVLNFPVSGPGGGCCGFYQPSQYLVNHFKTNANTGLPDLDNFNEVPVKNGEGLEPTDPFISYPGTLDPRLDRTVGRRGIPYLDWGLHTSNNWVVDQSYFGPYSPKKNVNPPFWETWWFRALMGVVVVLLFFGIYRLRAATLRKQKARLERTVKERTAEVVKQKEKSDELLLKILPLEVAEELKEKGYTTARPFDEVTVLFSDIKGFAHVAERLTAQQTVKEIDTYFSAFDNIMKQHGLEKIKTIGDAYIAAGGLPEGNKATPKNVVEAAIAMQQAVENLKEERVATNSPYFELGIGIHTGPVVAGVGA